MPGCQNTPLIVILNLYDSDMLYSVSTVAIHWAVVNLIGRKPDLDLSFSDVLVSNKRDRKRDIRYPFSEVKENEFL